MKIRVFKDKSKVIDLARFFFWFGVFVVGVWFENFILIAVGAFFWGYENRLIYEKYKKYEEK